MGQASMKHLIKHSDDLEIVPIVRESEKNKKLVKEFQDVDLDVVWGDIRDYIDVKNAIKDVDMIIHMAAMVSPKADYHPKLAWEINVGSVDNILRAIQELELWNVKRVYIGSVAQTGSRLHPIQWGQIGDPIKSSAFDMYAASKTAAERKIIESGLKYWVSLRQTGILHKGLLEVRDGIIFHQPLNNVLEWITEEDAGRMVANLCTTDLSETFWKRIYNVGGGKNCRLNNYDFMSGLLGLIGIKNIEKVFETKWFATRNFHGQYFLDSHVLNEYLNFRTESFFDFLLRIQKELKFKDRIIGSIPSLIDRNLIMKKIAKSEHGSLHWLKHNEEAKIKAFWGSREKQARIKDWKNIKLDYDYNQVQVLDHGYDERKISSILDLEDMKEAAKFRGGECLSKSMIKGDLDTHLNWVCALGHKFAASPCLVLKTGHWCDSREAPPWIYDEIAKHNPFFAQVWEKS